uniref:Uncharacterized protein n=1 Tax=Talaromyces marneffei PM1 TaxID=1077442 RepID=A0A093VH43_TALMA
MAAVSDSAAPSGAMLFNLLELESEGMVSVYLDGKFAWRLPKKLISMRVPKAIQVEHVTSEEIVNSGALRWEIEHFSQDAFRLFAEWLYNEIFANPDTLTSMGDAYDTLEAKSANRATISARFAALILGKRMDIQTLKPLLKSGELSHDMLVWITLYHQGGSEHQDFDEILTWMGQNCQLWIKALE